MRIYRHTEGVERGAAIAIGNFDGVHLGHRAVIEQAKAIARGIDAPLAVLTFEPHPRSVFSPATKPYRLTPFRAKSRLLDEVGVDLLFTLRFDRAFAAKSAEDFVAGLLARDLGVKHIVVGNDFTFGKGRAGTPKMLQAMAGPLGYGVTILDPVSDGDGKVRSASRIRAHLEAGEVREATELLGRPWEIEGRVRSGDKRGRDLGFPTANLAIGNYLHPAPGVYAVRAGWEENGKTVWRGGVADFGNRPTFAGQDWRLETFVFDFSGDLYGKHVRVQLIEFLRPDAKFTGADALVTAMREDERRARAIVGT